MNYLDDRNLKDQQLPIILGRVFEELKRCYYSLGSIDHRVVHRNNNSMVVD